MQLNIFNKVNAIKKIISHLFSRIKYNLLILDYKEINNNKCAVYTKVPSYQESVMMLNATYYPQVNGDNHSLRLCLV